VTAHHSMTETELAVQAKLGSVPLRREQMAVVSTIHRAVTAIRQHLENSVLRDHDLTWTGFVVLWVLWIWGGMETRYVAEEAGISKGTLTGVAKTLSSRGLVDRLRHPSDGRLAVLRLTEEGERLMEELFPRFNTEEAFVASPLETAEALSLADMLRRMVEHLETAGEQRRESLRGDTPPPPRRSGRRAKGESAQSSR
jgi:DNA-binding MarR family transcriptional regulator